MEEISGKQEGLAISDNDGGSVYAWVLVQVVLPLIITACAPPASIASLRLATISRETKNDEWPRPPYSPPISFGQPATIHRHTGRELLHRGVFNERVVPVALSYPHLGPTPARL